METKTVSCNRLYILWLINAVWHFNMGCCADSIDDYFKALEGPYLLVVLEIAFAVRLHIYFEDLFLVMTVKLLENCSCN